MEKEEVKKLKLGDKVICNKSFENLPQKGWIGKVIRINDLSISKNENISIEWEKNFGGHSCNGLGKNGYCRNYWVGAFQNENISIVDIYQQQFEFNF